jgi:hypothetical protein
LRCAYRYWLDTSSRNYNRGFRLSRVNLWPLRFWSWRKSPPLGVAIFFVWIRIDGILEFAEWKQKWII